MRNNGFKRLLCALAALSCLALLAACESKPAPSATPAPDAGIELKAEGETLASVSLAEIEKLPAVKRRLVVHSTKGDETCDFYGTLLSNVVSVADAELLTKYAYVLATGEDGYASYVTMDEVNMENNVYLMYMNNGEYLTSASGKPGAMRLVILKDSFGQRFTAYITQLELTNTLQ